MVGSKNRNHNRNHSGSVVQIVIWSRGRSRHRRRGDRRRDFITLPHRRGGRVADRGASAAAGDVGERISQQRVK